MENSCNFVGFVKHMTELRESKRKNHYLRFTLDNKVRNYHNYIPVVTFNKIAEELDKDVSDGDFIAINTSLNISNIEGQTRYSFTLNDFHVVDLTSEPRSDNEKADSGSSTKSAANDNNGNNKNETDEEKKINDISDKDLAKAYDEVMNSKPDQGKDNQNNDQSDQQGNTSGNRNDDQSEQDEQYNDTDQNTDKKTDNSGNNSDNNDNNGQDDDFFGNGNVPEGDDFFNQFN